MKVVCLKKKWCNQWACRSCKTFVGAFTCSMFGGVEWASGCRCCHLAGREITALTSQQKFFPGLNILSRTDFFSPLISLEFSDNVCHCLKIPVTIAVLQFSIRLFLFNNLIFYKIKQFNLSWSCNSRPMSSAVPAVTPARLPRALELNLISIQRLMIDHSGSVVRRQHHQSSPHKVLLPAYCQSNTHFLCLLMAFSCVKSPAAFVSSQLSAHCQSFPHL